MNGWFSQKHLNHMLKLDELGLDSSNKKARLFCIYEKTDGEYAIITTVGDESEDYPTRWDDVISFGEVKRCLITTVTPSIRIEMLDQQKLARACQKIGWNCVH